MSFLGVGRLLGSTPTVLVEFLPRVLWLAEVAAEQEPVTDDDAVGFQRRAPAHQHRGRVQRVELQLLWRCGRSCGGGHRWEWRRSTGSVIGAQKQGLAAVELFLPAGGSDVLCDDHLRPCVPNTWVHRTRTGQGNEGGERRGSGDGSGWVTAFNGVIKSGPLPNWLTDRDGGTERAPQLHCFI